MRAACLLTAITALLLSAPAAAAAPTMAEVLAATTAQDWRSPDPDDTLYLELDTGRVVIELAADFAPRHVDNLRALARGGYFDGLAIVRVQENYVVQWGDPDAANPDKRRSTGDQPRTLAAEFARAVDGAPPFARLADGDVYAPQVGHSLGFPVARDPEAGTTWLAHCYGMVGAGRDNAADSSNGSQLYVVIGHAPRHLDRNITLVGRVLQGMELLSVLPRGKGPLGFYETAAERVPITRIRLASQVPEAERVALEVFRTDTPAFNALVESRRNRREEWFIDPVGKIELCNVPIPVRLAKAAPAPK